jgi:HK97 family phage portal protein
VSLFFKRGGEVRQNGWFGTGADYNPAQRVTENSALRLAPLFAAVRFVVDFVSTLPADAYRLEGKTRKDITLPPLLARQDDQGGPGLVSWLGQAAFGLACGNAVGWVIATDGFGFPTDVQWLHWTQWTYDEQTKQWYVHGQPVPSSSVVHIPWIVPPGRRLGLSPIEHQAAVICAGLSAQDYADLRRGGGIPPTVLKNNSREVDREVAADMKRAASASFARGEPFITGMDWDLTIPGIPPNQAQFVETLQMTANQIAAAYGIDPTELGGTPGGSLTYNTEELREIRRAADAEPYIRRLECGLSRLLPARQYVKLNVDAKIRADLKTRTEVVGAQIADGRMSVNEAREIEDREPVDGGDFHNIPTPLTPIKDPINPYSLARNGQSVPAIAGPTNEGAPL